jgi:hypothetical protein
VICLHLKLFKLLVNFYKKERCKQSNRSKKDVGLWLNYIISVSFSLLPSLYLIMNFYMQGWYNYIILKDLLGDGIFTVDGDKWRQQRKISSHEFSTKVLRDSSSLIFRKHAAKLANMVSEAATSNQIIEIQVSLDKSIFTKRLIPYDITR